MPFCWLWFNSITDDFFTYVMKQLLYRFSEGLYISWDSMCTIYFWCCHNVLFFVLEKVSFFFTFVIGNYFLYHLSKYSLCCLPKSVRSQGCLREEYFSCGEIKFREMVKVNFGTQKFPRISEYLYLSKFIFSRDLQRSHLLYILSWTDGRLRLFLTHINICCWF